MRERLTWFAAGAAVSLFSVLTTLALTGSHARWTAERHAGSHVLLSPEDFIEIQHLYGMYARDVDPGAVRTAAWMFTDDAEVALGSKPRLKGKKQIRRFYKGVNKRDEGGDRHFNTTPVIVGLPDGTARGSVYMLGALRRERRGPIELNVFGKYEDKLVKTADGWRIQERVWQSDTYMGSGEAVIASPVPGRPATYATGIEERMAEAEE